MAQIIKKVLANIAQALTASEKSTARSNIGAVSNSELRDLYSEILDKESTSVFYVCAPYAGDVVADRGVLLDLKKAYVLSHRTASSMENHSPSEIGVNVPFGKLIGIGEPAYESNEWIRDARHVVLNVLGDGGQNYNRFRFSVEDAVVGRQKIVTLNNMTGSALTVDISAASSGLDVYTMGSMVSVAPQGEYGYVIGAGVCKHIAIMRLPDIEVYGGDVRRQLAFIADT
jgi:hypothetical protein